MWKQLLFGYLFIAFILFMCSLIYSIYNIGLKTIYSEESGINWFTVLSIPQSLLWLPELINYYR